MAEIRPGKLDAYAATDVQLYAEFTVLVPTGFCVYLGN